MQADIRKKILELKTKPPNAETLLNLAKLLISVKNYSEAIHALMEIVSHEKSAEANLLLGEIYYLLRDLTKANQYFSEAIKINSRSLDAYLGLAKTHFLLKNYVTCQDNLEYAKTIDADNVNVLLMDLVLNYNLYRLECLDSLLSSLSLKSLTPETKLIVDFIHGLLLLARRRNSQALSKLESLKTREPFANPNHKEYFIILNSIGLCYLRMKNFEVAKKLFSDLVSKFECLKENILDKHSGSIIYLNYSITLWLNGEYVPSLLYFEKVHQISRDIYPYYLAVKEYVQSKGASLKVKVKSLKSESTKRGLNYGLYLGCVIPNRYPMDELATRVVLDYLDIGVKDLEGASCCPAPGVFRSFDIPTWLTLGARNISISEQLNRDLITMCNGCYGTLLEVSHTLKHDNKARDSVNEKLAEINKRYKGTSEVLHVVDVLYNKIGIEALKKYIVNSLNLKVAVHYGCHLIKSSKTRPWCGETENPRFFEELVEITGCKAVDYKDRLMCCGAGGGVRSAVKEVSLDFTREKLENMRSAGAEAIIVACPFCQLQFDLGQNEVNAVFRESIGDPFSIPVIYITQLLGLAFGLDPTVLGLQRFKMAGLPPFQPTEVIFTKDLDGSDLLLEKLNSFGEK